MTIINVKLCASSLLCGPEPIHAHLMGFLGNGHPSDCVQ